VKKKMSTKLIVALAIVAVLAVAVVGLVSAQIATSAPNGSPNGATNNGFFGWMGRCFGLRGTQYYGAGTTAYQGLPANITVTDPNTGVATTYQGNIGYGRCMGFRP
jgi:hypothetical protein